MVRTGRIPYAVKERADELLAQGTPYKDICAELDVSTRWITMRAHDRSQTKVSDTRKTDQTRGERAQARLDSRAAQTVGRPIPYDELGGDQRRALEDFEFFALRYFGLPLLGWQREAAAKTVELLESPEEEFAVYNVAPGAGKTTITARVLPAWLTCRDRAMRGMQGSATNTVATRSVDLLRSELTRERPFVPTSKDAKAGIVAAEATLPGDFGLFRPDFDGAVWTRSMFEVLINDETRTGNKEPTWVAFGRDTTFLGWRADFVVWDDLWVSNKLRTSDSREEFFHWYDDTAETRVEPGGLFLLVGQRLDAGDVYRYALDKLGYDPEDDLDDELVDAVVEQTKATQAQMADAVDVNPRAGLKYHHIVFPAFDPSKDVGTEAERKALRKRTAPSWPDGPLLAPGRLTWRKLETIRKNRPDMFDLVYQQDDSKLEETLVNRLWIEGGTDPQTGEMYPGCRDNDRKMWEVPQGLAPPVVSVATTDPSHTAFWASTWSLWQPGDEISGDVRHLMAMDNKRMDAPSFLDWNSATHTWSGLAETWFQESRELGHPIRYWIVEQNGAQRYLLQFEHVRKWMSSRGVQIIAHTTTGRNKKDDDYGVQSLGPVFRRGSIRLPMGDINHAGQKKDNLKILDLIKQVTSYPHGTYDDLVMALWFFEAQRDVLRPNVGAQEQVSRPRFLNAFKVGRAA